MAEALHVEGSLVFSSRGSYLAAIEEVFDEIEFDEVVANLLARAEWPEGPGVRFRWSASVGADAWLALADALEMLAYGAVDGVVEAAWGRDEKRFVARRSRAPRISEAIRHFLLAEVLRARSDPAYRAVVRAGTATVAHYPLEALGGVDSLARAARRWVGGAAAFGSAATRLGAELLRSLEACEAELSWEAGAPALATPPSWWGPLEDVRDAGRAHGASPNVRAFSADMAAIESEAELSEVLVAGDEDLRWFVQDIVADRERTLPDVRSSVGARVRVRIVDACRDALRARDAASVGRLAKHAAQEVAALDQRLSRGDLG